MKIKKSSLILLILIGFASIGGVVSVFLFSGNNKPTDAEMLTAFNNLLNDWSLTLPGTYKVNHYKEREIHSEWGTVLLYFQLELSSELARSWLSDPKLTRLHLSSRPALLPVTPNIYWWKEDAPAECFYGFLQTKDSRQYLRLNVVFGRSNALAYVESLSRKGEKK